MSYSNKQINNKFNNKSAKVAPKPYCKVCHDAGKSESEYTNHFVRSSPAPDAVVVCPTLLSQKCTYCDKSGHTQSYCKLKLKAEKQWLKEANKQTFECNKPLTNAKVSFVSANKFDMMMDSNDSDSEIESSASINVKITSKKNVTFKQSENKIIEEKKEEFPALPTRTSKSSISRIVVIPQVSFSAMVSKTAEEYEAEQHEKALAEQMKKTFIPPLTIKKPILKASDPECDWAMEDSDSDCDDDKSVQEEDDTYDW